MGTQANPPLILYSLNIELMRNGNWDEINSKYLEVALKLQQAGAKAIIICANTPHMVYPYVAPKIDIPILHIADATGQQARRLGLSKLGLLGNKPTMTKGFIQSRIKEKFGMETIIPAEQYIDQSHYYISKELTQGKFTQESKAFYQEQMQLLKANGAEGIILGCTELPLLLKAEDFDLPLLATTQLHVEMAMTFILGENAKDAY